MVGTRRVRPADEWRGRDARPRTSNLGISHGSPRISSPWACWPTARSNRLRAAAVLDSNTGSWRPATRGARRAAGGAT